MLCGAGDGGRKLQECAVHAWMRGEQHRQQALARRREAAIGVETPARRSSLRITRRAAAQLLEETLE